MFCKEKLPRIPASKRFMYVWCQPNPEEESSALVWLCRQDQKKQPNCCWNIPEEGYNCPTMLDGKVSWMKGDLIVARWESALLIATATSAECSGGSILKNQLETPHLCLCDWQQWCVARSHSRFSRCLCYFLKKLYFSVWSQTLQLLFLTPYSCYTRCDHRQATVDPPYLDFIG